MQKFYLAHALHGMKHRLIDQNELMIFNTHFDPQLGIYFFVILIIKLIFYNLKSEHPNSFYYN